MTIMRKLQILAIGLIFTVSAFGQTTFEQPQIDDNEFDHVKVKVGADFAIQYQALNNLPIRSWSHWEVILTSRRQILILMQTWQKG